MRRLEHESEIVVVVSDFSEDAGYRVAARVPRVRRPATAIAGVRGMCSGLECPKSDKSSNEVISISGA
jgi:hypothetical protein